MFNLYLAAATRIEAGNRLSYISDTSNAIATVLGDGKKTKEHFDLLKETSEGIQRG